MVTPLEIGTPDNKEGGFWPIGGSLDASSEIPVAIRLNTFREGEYYLIENRRFTSWDEGMSLMYPEAVSKITS